MSLEAMLNFNHETGQWEGEDAKRMVKMDDATFQRYVLVWVQLKMRTETPTREQMELGREHCRRLAYWRDCENNYDPRVNVRRRR